jgi:hypothetical protein
VRGEGPGSLSRLGFLKRHMPTPSARCWQEAGAHAPSAGPLSSPRPPPRTAGRSRAAASPSAAAQAAEARAAQVRAQPRHNAQLSTWLGDGDEGALCGATGTSS